MDLRMAAQLAGAAALGAALLVPGVKRLALKGGAVDVPDARRVSTKVTPRLGGLAIFLAFALVIVLFGLLGKVSLAAGTPHIVAFFVAAALVVGIGALDDFRPLRPHAKLIVELAAALIVVYGGNCRIAGVSVPGRPAVLLGAATVPITVLWIVLVTNAVNLIDGIDGLAAGTSAIALLTIAVIAHGFGYPTVSAFAVVLAGACAGFLIFNVHPASIFLGDAGSLFLGFAIAVLSTYARAKESTGAITIGTLLIVALPVGDALFAIPRRYFHGLAVGSWRSHVAGLTRVFQPDRNHIHHRLMRVGLGQRGVAWALYSIQALACGYALYLLVKR
jgi:UDP-GlcNAc:undecaprenyl-phosphate GlcNAc-1-phosphate transferase